MGGKELGNLGCGLKALVGLEVFDEFSDFHLITMSQLHREYH